MAPPSSKVNVLAVGGGAIAGLVDGGAGNLGTLVLDGNSGNVVSTPSGSHSGPMAYQGQPVAYAGMAPIVVASPTRVTVTGSAANDTLDVGPNPSITGGWRVASLSPVRMEVAPSRVPTVSLTIVDTATGGLIIGNLMIPGATLEIDSQNITLNSSIAVNTTKTGRLRQLPVTLNASAEPGPPPRRPA